MPTVYPYTYPLILNNVIFSQYGGKGTGSFPQEVLDSAFIMAEQQTTNYIGTFLLPTIVTGTFVTPQTRVQRIATDYGYVSEILGVVIKNQKVTHLGGELTNRDGTSFIYEDTFGYLDIYKLHGNCGGCGDFGYPYQYQIAYEAGLPTGTANQPLMLAAMTAAAQINLNEMFPGVVGVNEGTGDVGIQEFESFGYHERRTAHALYLTAFGGSAQASRIARMIKSCVKLARRALKVS